MPASKLVLCPAEPSYRPGSTHTLQSSLKNIGFIGEEFVSDAAGKRYLVGERFLQLITFMGCSPYVAMEAPEPGSLDFCHVSISTFGDGTQLLYGRNTTAPRCPSCRYRWGDWREHILNWTSNPSAALPCPGCGQPVAPMDLDWRNHAGAGQTFIEVHHVFPGEAVPVDELMGVLADISGTSWKHFYIQE